MKSELLKHEMGRAQLENCQLSDAPCNAAQGDGPHWAYLVVAQQRLFLRHGTVLLWYDLAAR